MYVNLNAAQVDNASAPLPVGGLGRVTAVTSEDGPTFLICRTQRRQGGWGVHTDGGDLLSSGWTTLTQARKYALRLQKKAEGE